MSLPAFVLDRIIRRRAALHRAQVEPYRVRIAQTVEEYADAFKLLHVAYVYQGIESIRGVSLRITPQHVLPEATVLVVYEGAHLVGTMTVVQDSPAGLPLDKDYPEELAALRRRGARLVEYGSLAVVRRCWHTGVTTLLNMAAHHLTRNQLAASHVVMGINPRAAPYYRAVYRFALLGAAKPHAELAAPVVGMVQEVSDVERHLRTTANKPMSTGVSFFAYATSVPPPGLTVPTSLSGESLARWKMSRAVFQELFLKRSDRIQNLDPATRRHLEARRSRMTLRIAAKEARPVADATTSALAIV